MVIHKRLYKHNVEHMVSGIDFEEAEGVQTPVQYCLETSTLTEYSPNSNF